MTFAWTETTIGRLRALWTEGRSASEIAVELRAESFETLSRSAVIGKLNRLGFKRETKPKPMKALPAPRVARRARFNPIDERRPAPVMAAMVPAEPVLSLDPTKIPQAQRRTLLQLTNETCRFPYGEGADLFFCGGPGADLIHGVAYCPAHCRIAYRRPAVAA